MIATNFKHKLKNILVMGAHCDDIEIGCGGTILKLLDEYPDCMINWIVFSSNDERKQEAQKSAEYFLKKTSNKNIIIKEFRNGFFPYVAIDIKDYFEEYEVIVYGAILLLVTIFLPHGLVGIPGIVKRWARR